MSAIGDLFAKGREAVETGMQYARAVADEVVPGIVAKGNQIKDGAVTKYTQVADDVHSLVDDGADIAVALREVAKEELAAGMRKLTGVADDVERTGAQAADDVEPTNIGLLNDHKHIRPPHSS